MRRYSSTSILGIIGMVTWIATILLRELSINNICISFILGIMPNISAAWLFIWLGEIIIKQKSISSNFRIISIISGMIFLLTVVSEIIHDKFLNSPFDVYDIIATIVSIVIYLVVFYFSNRTLKSTDQS